MTSENTSVVDMEKPVTESQGSANASPCPKCGKMITEKPGPRARHISICTGDGAITKPASNDEMPMPKVADAELARQIEVARRVAADRVKEAPEIMAGGGSDEMDVLSKTEQRLRQAGIIPPDMHVFWGDKDEAEYYPTRGYIPVVNRGRQEQVREVLMYMIPKSVTRAEQVAASRLSRSTFLGHLGEGAAADLAVSAARDPTARKLDENVRMPDPTDASPLKRRDNPTEPI